MLIDIGFLLPTVIMVGIVFLPIAVTVVTVFYLKRVEARDERRSPLNDKLLHQAGSQARRKADELGDDLMARVTLQMLIGPLAMMVILLPRVRWSQIKFGLMDGVVIGLAIGAVVWCTRDILRYRQQRRQWRNGMRGEMAAAQELDRLRVRGCEVFHDLPGDRGNIDHVIVAPNAVFVVETKWRSKKGQGGKSAEVWFDGKALEFPNGYRDAAPLEQAYACATEIGKYLQRRTGERVRVIPVVALPGWYAQNRREAASAEAVVINPKLAYRLLEMSGPRVPDAQRTRIIAAISERYPQQQD